MSRSEALKLAARALHASGQRDAASGNGMDLAVITAKDGYQQISQQEISKLLK
jgi:20S proteasome alpha/beta subunit